MLAAPGDAGAAGAAAVDDDAVGKAGTCSDSGLLSSHSASKSRVICVLIASFTSTRIRDESW